MLSEVSHQLTSCVAAAPRRVRSESSVVWFWTRPAASSCLHSASRSESGDFTCSTVCTSVRPPRPRSRSGDNTRTLVGSLRAWSRIKETAALTEQIRVALKDWEDMKKFENDAVNAQHHDVVYILHRLMFIRAFHFTAMPTLVRRPPLSHVLLVLFSIHTWAQIMLINMELSTNDCT